MDSTHPDRELLTRFLLLETNDQESLKVSLHLRRCLPCQAQAQKVQYDLELQGSIVVAVDEDAEQAERVVQVDRLMARAARTVEEREQAPALWATLAKRSEPARFAWVRNKARFHTLGFANFLIKRSREVVRENPAEALSLASLAFVAASYIRPEDEAEAMVVNDVRIEARVEAANGLRCQYRFGDARHRLEESEEYLDEGSGDPLLRARLDSVRGSLFIDIGEFELAAKSLNAAAVAYALVGDWGLFGSTRVTEAAALRHVNPAAGIASANEALEVLDPESFAYLCGRHNLIDCLNEAGFAHLALMEYRKTEARFQSADLKSQLQGRWLEARIVAEFAILTQRREIINEADDKLWEVSDDFIEAGHLQPGAIAQLELVRLFLLTHRNRRAYRAAKRAMNIFRMLDVPVDVLSALLALEAAAKKNVADAAFVAALRDRFSRYWLVGVGSNPPK